MTEFEILQENLEARLNAIAYFSDVTVMAMCSRMVGTKLVTVSGVDELLELALQGRRLKEGKTGAAVAIMKAGFEARHENLPGPQGKMVIAVRVQVDPAVNGLASIGTGKSAEEIALEVLKAGHQFQIGGVGTLKAGADAFPRIPACPAPARTATPAPCRGGTHGRQPRCWRWRWPRPKRHWPPRPKPASGWWPSSRWERSL